MQFCSNLLQVTQWWYVSFRLVTEMDEVVPNIRMM